MSTSLKQEVRTVSGTQSLALVRNMLRLSISSICYSRNLFPLDCFAARPYGSGSEFPMVHQLESVKLNEKGENEVVNTDAFLITQWLERGVFDALQKTFLKQMIFAIMIPRDEKLAYDDNNSSLLETYTFNISYSDVNGKILPSLNGVPATKENLKKQAISFIRNLTSFIGSLELIPSERILTLKLVYHDHTPEDYEPEFFSAQSDNDKKFFKFEGGGKIVKIKIGQIATSDHAMDLRISHMENLFDQLPPDNNMTSYNSASSVVDVTSDKGIFPLLNESAMNDHNTMNKLSAFESQTLAVKAYISKNEKASVKDCMKEFENVLNGPEVRKIFQCLVEEEFIQPKGRGYACSHTLSVESLHLSEPNVSQTESIEEDNEVESAKTGKKRLPETPKVLKGSHARSGLDLCYGKVPTSDHGTKKSKVSESMSQDSCPSEGEDRLVKSSMITDPIRQGVNSNL